MQGNPGIQEDSATTREGGGPDQRTTRGHDESARLHIWTLGHFRVERDGLAVPASAWRRSGGTALKALLIHRQITRDRMADFLFPDVDADIGRSRLNEAIHVLRKALEPDLKPGAPSRYLRQEGQFLTLRLGAEDWLDFEEFERCLRAAAVADTPLPLLMRARELYGGDLFAEESGSWCLSARQKLNRRWQRAMLRLAEEQERLGERDEASLTLQALVDADVTYEPAVRQLMLNHVRHGSARVAMRLYHQLETALRNEVGVPPAPETRALATAIRNGTLPPP